VIPTPHIGGATEAIAKLRILVSKLLCLEMLTLNTQALIGPATVLTLKKTSGALCLKSQNNLDPVYQTLKSSCNF